MQLWCFAIYPVVARGRPSATPMLVDRHPCPLEPSIAPAMSPSTKAEAAHETLDPLVKSPAHRFMAIFTRAVSTRMRAFERSGRPRLSDP